MPETDTRVLAERCVHGVPEEIIVKMKERWDATAEW
jgi:hypothetical protein